MVRTAEIILIAIAFTYVCCGKTRFSIEYSNDRANSCSTNTNHNSQLLSVIYPSNQELTSRDEVIKFMIVHNPTMAYSDIIEYVNTINFDSSQAVSDQPSVLEIINNQNDKMANAPASAPASTPKVQQETVQAPTQTIETRASAYNTEVIDNSIFQFDAVDSSDRNKLFHWMLVGDLGVKFNSLGAIRCSNSKIALYEVVPVGTTFDTSKLNTTRLNSQDLEDWKSEKIKCYSGQSSTTFINVASLNELIEPSLKRRLCYYGLSKDITEISKSRYLEIPEDSYVNCSDAAWRSWFNLDYNISSLFAELFDSCFCVVLMN